MMKTFILLQPNGLGLKYSWAIDFSLTGDYGVVMPKTRQSIWSGDVTSIQRTFTNADILLFEVEDSVHKGLPVPDAEEVQRLCVLIAARYATAAGMLYTVIRHQKEQENLKQILEDNKK